MHQKVSLNSLTVSSPPMKPVLSSPRVAASVFHFLGFARRRSLCNNLEWEGLKPRWRLWIWSRVWSSSWWETPQRSCSSRPCPRRRRWSRWQTGGRRCSAGTAPPGGRSAERTGSPGTSRRFGSSSSAGWEPGRSSPGGRRRGEWEGVCGQTE